MCHLVLLVMCQSDGGGKAVKKREEVERPAHFHRTVQTKIIPTFSLYLLVLSTLTVTSERLCSTAADI